MPTAEPRTVTAPPVDSNGHPVHDDVAAVRRPSAPPDRATQDVGRASRGQTGAIHLLTVGRQTYPLPQPFFVVATQNPIEMEGTYPLPEAQVDRFMFSLLVAYPSIEEEVRIIKGTTGTAVAKATAALGTEEVLRLQEYVRGVPIADSVVNYAARLVSATRPGCGGPAELHKYIAYGASPRASQCLVLGAKAGAILAGRFHVDFADL